SVVSQERVTKKVCMGTVDEISGPDASIFIRKVKQGVGGAVFGEPLWEADIPMIASPDSSKQVCADLTLPERGGVQFKVFVNFRSIAGVTDVGKRIEMLDAKRNILLTKYLCTNMLSDDANVSKSFKSQDCVTYDKYTGNVFILLNQYGF